MEILFKNFLEGWDAIFCGREACEKIWQTEFPHEYFANVILSSSVIGILFQNNILVFDWCPYEPLRSNVELILGEDHNTHFFAEKCFYGVHAKTVETEKWEASLLKWWSSYLSNSSPASVQACLWNHCSYCCHGYQKLIAFDVGERTPCRRVSVG